MSTVHVPDDTHQRLKQMKPFETMSHGEFIDHLLDQYQEGSADE